MSEILSDFKGLHLDTEIISSKTRSGRVFKERISFKSETGVNIPDDQSVEREIRRSLRLKNKSSVDLSLNETVLDILENVKTENDNETINYSKTPRIISTPRTPNTDFQKNNQENYFSPKTPKYNGKKYRTPRPILADISSNLPLVSEPDKLVFQLDSLDLETSKNEKTRYDTEVKSTKTDNKTPRKITTPRTPKADFQNIIKENTSTPKTPKSQSNKYKSVRPVLEDISSNLSLVSKPDTKLKRRSKSEDRGRRQTPVRLDIWTNSICESVLDIQDSYLNDSCSVSHCDCEAKCLPNKCSCRLGDILCGGGCGCNRGCSNVYVRIENIVKVRPSLIPGAGLGCFLTQRVKAGQLIQEYLGEIVSRLVSDRRKSLTRNSYLVQLDDKLDIDGARGGSEVRCSNHSKNPSAEFTWKYIRIPGGVRRAVYVRARRALNPGDEVTLDYGPEYPTSNFCS